VAEVDGIEAIRNNQKVFGLATKYSPTSIAASGGIVVVGGQECLLLDIVSIRLMFLL
jgi:hypothetical protein